MKSNPYRECRSIRYCGGTKPSAKGSSSSLPDREGEVRPGCDDRAVAAWNATASRLHFNRDFRINSQSLAACLTPTKAIGGRAWPNFILEHDEWASSLVLWSNTTLGLIAFWWIGTRQHQGRASVPITQLPRLTVLDPRTLGVEQIDHAEAIFERFRRGGVPAGQRGLPGRHSSGPGPRRPGGTARPARSLP